MSLQIWQSGVPDIDGVLWGWCWQANQPNNHTLLTYSFPTSTADYGYTISGFEAFDAGQRAAAMKILAMYDGVCNADFVPAGHALGNIRMAEADWVNVGTGNTTITSGLGCAPDPNFAPLVAQGDTWFNHVDYNTPVLGDFAFASGLMHEIGHALGLKHGHLTQGVQDSLGNVLYTNPALAFDHDSLEFSVMTYRSYPGAPIDIVYGKEFPSTPMQDDIYALQYIYGANYGWQAGNTVYSFSPTTGVMSINGVSQGETFHGKIFCTIWDGGGNDTYDFSNYTTNAVINLNPGAWSTPSQAQLADLDFVHPGIHFARGCVANALLFAGDTQGYIENAAGGSGNDVILGNIMSNGLFGGPGNDVISGGAGADAIIGGAGADTLAGNTGADHFYFSAASDSGKGALKHDLILDFNPFEYDAINLSDMDAKSRKGLQHFKFIGSHHFHDKAGELRSSKFLLQGDIDGNGKADFEVVLNVAKLGVGDLILV